MRRCIALIVVAAGAAALSGLADASPRFSATFQLAYSNKRPGASTGLSTTMTWRDPGELGGKPKAIRRIELRFHPGTRLDTSALPACHASDEQIRRAGPSACPASSRLGTGSTEAVLIPGLPLQTTVALFNAKDQIIVVVTSLGIVLTEFRDDVKPGVIVVNPALPPGVSLAKLHIRLDPHSSGQGPQLRTYMRTPPRCPPGRSWTIAGTFTYADGSAQTLTTSSPCVPAKRKVRRGRR